MSTRRPTDVRADCVRLLEAEHPELAAELAAIKLPGRPAARLDENGFSETTAARARMYLEIRGDIREGASREAAIQKACDKYRIGEDAAWNVFTLQGRGDVRQYLKLRGHIK